MVMFFVILAGAMTQAQETSVPPLVNYQGMLTDADGKPLTGTKKIEFNLYDAAMGGTKIWGPQIFASVPLVNGSFNVILSVAEDGKSSIADAFGGKDRYLGIKVGDEAELAPRQQILSTPFAINAKSLNGYNLQELIDLIRSPDYDSGWFFVEPGNNYDKEHNLGSLPRSATIWGATDSDGSNMYLLTDGHKWTNGGHGCWLQKVTTNSYRISTGTKSAMWAGGTDYFTDWSNLSGYIKVLMWK
ncbi:Uncharacterized protein dnm_066850 [Desulfonema magnum]|uniref:Uncharacterized protein n=1 Tax=Desulfonema magnum TaxID=45655 RepID=A0A975BSY5_9BACT|nr:Uncharacterized protein dnm_066850 [Desulfonema magnum]